MTADRTAAWVSAAGSGWPAGVRALTTRRRGPAGQPFWNLADHVGDEPAAVAGNRRALLQATGVEAVQWLNQVHGSRCVEATTARSVTVPDADAVWTRQPRLGVAVLTADCVPVVVGDRSASVVGVAHGGWRGLVGGVLESLIAALPVAAADLVAWIGPAIGPDVYEVGDDVRGALARLPGGAGLLDDCCRAGAEPGKHWLDLFTLSERLLLRAGVGAVVTDRICCYTDERYFSYRRDGGRTGRMATLAWLDGG